jgi:lysophospholipase L1-like esterase
MGIRRDARRLKTSAAATIVTALALALLAACGGGSTDARSDGAEYVAMGDSMSSGAGIAPVADTTCFRSKVNYPSLVAKQMQFTSFEDVTCAGADTTHLLKPQVIGITSHRAQLDALGTRTKLVTITIGLNDNRLASGLLAACLDPTGKPSAACDLVLGASEATLEKQYAAAADRVVDALNRIQKEAPNARVILIGYPRYFPDSGSCPDRVPMVEAMVDKDRTAFAVINDDWKQAAERAGVEYVDTYQLSNGHDICSDMPWMNGASNAPDKALPMHPFAAFHEAVAARIVQLLNE